MACTFCRHFDEDEGNTRKLSTGDIVARVRAEKGVCTLSPTWQEVTGLHYCSQFSPARAGDVAGFFVRMHESFNDAEKERKRRIELEKKIKELRLLRERELTP